MRMPRCHYRHPLPMAHEQFLCAHPRVHAQDHLVTPEICALCRLHQSSVPPRPLESLHRRKLNGSGSRSTTVAGILSTNPATLSNALESVVGQSCPPAQIIVFGSEEDSLARELAEIFAMHRARYQALDQPGLHSAWEWLLHFTCSQLLCLFTSEEWLTRLWLQQATEVMDKSHCGLVLSPFDLPNGKRLHPPLPHEPGGSRLPGSGCLVRRAMLQSSLVTPGDPSCSWSSLMADGWTAEKISHPIRRAIDHGTDLRSLQVQSSEPVTLFVPLSGRSALWPQMATFLNQQSWPHDAISLLLLDTSQNPEFSQNVRQWLATCDYPDARYCQKRVGPTDLADAPRRRAQQAVSQAMARIYNWMAQQLSTPRVWIIEDDILPPLDALATLMEGMDETTASVSGCYHSRHASGYVAWHSNQSRITQPGSGLEAIGGNGFGCALLLSTVVQQTVFAATDEHPAYDNAFYAWLQQTGWKAKIHWEVRCRHGNLP